MSKPSPVSPVVSSLHPRLARELKTVFAMIRLYCRAHHQATGLCDECVKLSEYAERRLAACPFQEEKTTCGKCTVHCYKATMRKQIIEVMRFSGPKMIFHHPFLALAHLIDKNPIHNKPLPFQPKNKKRS